MFHYFGHNCFFFETDHSALAVDPWFSNEGAFFGSWFQYPCNHHLREDLLSRLLAKRAYIYITHEHLDHYDPSFLESLRTRAKIILPTFKDNYLLKRLKADDFDIIEIADGQNFTIDDDLAIKTMVADVGINHDSAILIKHSDFVFLNQNDCKVFDRLAEIEETVDYYSVQFSGATGHPACYTYNLDNKIAISKKKTDTKLNNVKKGIETLKPRHFIPAAGPAIFPYLDPSLSFGRDNIFIHQDHLAAFFAENNIEGTVYMRPGDIFSDDKTAPVPPPTRAEFDAYKKSVPDVWHTIDAVFSPDLLKQAVDSRLAEISDLRFDPCPIIFFCWGNGTEQTLSIDLNNKQSSFGRIKAESFIELRAEEKYFALMQEGHRWQDIYLSLRAKIFRQPDTFSNFTNIFLFSDVSNICNAFKSTIDIPADRIQLNSPNGAVYEVDRYCPHQGGDLSKANIDAKGNLVCPRHGWKFDLNQGGVNLQSGKSVHAVCLRSET